MTSVAARRIAWTLVALAVVALVLATALALSKPEIESPDQVTFTISVLAFALVGARVVDRQPRNPIGWILCVAGLVYALMGLTDIWANVALNDGLVGGTLAAWVSSWLWLVGVGTANTFLLLLFPTGRLPSRAWRPVALLAAGSLLVAVPALAFTPGSLVDYGVDNPVGIAGADLLSAVGLAGFVAAALASIASLFARYRRANWRERQQLKWLLLAAVVVILALVSTLALDLAVPSLSTTVVDAVVTTVATALPLAIGVAILRHGMFDVDVVINRTLVYGALTASLAAVYLGSVLVLQVVLRPVTEESNLAIAGSTLAVAALFRPARARIQALVDRRFYRRRYDAQRTLEAFSARLRDEVALDSLSAELNRVVRETVQPAHVSLWLRTPEPRR